MKSTVVTTLFAAAVLAASVAAHADVRAPSDPGRPLKSAKLNGAKFNGMALNGPGLIVQGRTFNGLALNGPGLIVQGRNFNGLALNGPGIILQGRAFNGLALNGPGIVLQGNRFNGFRFNGSEFLGLDAWGKELTTRYATSCMAPQQAREWPLSALSVSDVTVRLATR